MTGQNYRIRIRSHMDDSWQTWFDGLTIQRQPNGETVLTGVVQDQAALFGALMKIRDLGLTLLALEPVESQPESGRPA